MSNKNFNEFLEGKRSPKVNHFNFSRLFEYSSAYSPAYSPAYPTAEFQYIVVSSTESEPRESKLQSLQESVAQESC